MGSAPEGSGKGTFFQKSFPPQGVLSTPSRLKATPRTGRGAGEVPARWASRSFSKPDDIAFKQGKVARKLFAPGIGEGSPGATVRPGGPLAAAHEASGRRW